MTRHWRAGFSLLELLVVICIVAVLATVLLNRLQMLQVQAERASTEHVVGAMRSAAALEAARALLDGEPERLRRFEGTNPMALLAERPGTYLGELEAPDPATIEPGAWYFDRAEGVLVYRVRFGDFLETALPGPRRLRFKLRVVSADSTPAGSFEPGRNEVRGLTVSPVEPYRWVPPREAKKEQRS